MCLNYSFAYVLILFKNVCFLFCFVFLQLLDYVPKFAWLNIAEIYAFILVSSTFQEAMS